MAEPGLDALWESNLIPKAVVTFWLQEGSRRRQQTDTGPSPASPCALSGIVRALLLAATLGSGGRTSPARCHGAQTTDGTMKSHRMGWNSDWVCNGCFLDICQKI